MLETLCPPRSGFPLVVRWKKRSYNFLKKKERLIGCFIDRPLSIGGKPSISILTITTKCLAFFKKKGNTCTTRPCLCISRSIFHGNWRVCKWLQKVVIVYCCTAFQIIMRGGGNQLEQCTIRLRFFSFSFLLVVSIYNSVRDIGTVETPSKTRMGFMVVMQSSLYAHLITGRLF